MARITEYGRPQKKFHWAQQGKMANILHVIRFFLYHLRSCWKHNLLKKGHLSIEKKMANFFSGIIEHARRQGTIYTGPEGILTLILEDIR